MLGFENVAAEIVDITFTVRATGGNANRYEPNVQRLFMRAAQFVEPVVPLVERADTDADGVVADLSEIAVGRNGEEYLGKRTYGDFFMFEDDDNNPGTPEVRAGGVTFTETDPVAGFSVSADGMVSVTNLSITGSYTYTVQAVSDGFTGVALFTVSVEVGKSGGIKFNNQNVVVGGDVLITTEIKESDKVSGTPDALLRVNMVYHGQRRGLHWIYGDKYYRTQEQVDADTPDNGLRSGLNTDWYSKRICEEIGNKDDKSAAWRLPTLIEMAGGVLPGDENSETNFAALVAGVGVGKGLSMFELNGPRDTTGIDTVNLTAKSVNSDDAGELKADAAISFANLGYFAGVFNAATDDTRGSPAHVYYTNNQVRVSDAADKGRVVCVHDTTGYEKTAVWAELSVDDGTPGSSADSGAYRIVTPSITLSVVGAKATADLKVGLGVFTVRGEMAPQAVADETVISNLSIGLQDSQNVFTVSPVAVSGGGVKLEVSVPSDADAASIPDTGIYTLSVTFAPTGDYVGFAQRDFEKTSFGAVDKVQFDVVRLTVNWTKPAVELASNIVFGVVTISTSGRTVTATAADRIGGGPISANMEYYGDVGGLRVMFSRNALPVSPGVGPRLCEAGNAAGGESGWRNPTLSELGMLLSGQSVTVLTLTVVIDPTGVNFSPVSGSASEGLGVGAPGIVGSSTKEIVLTFPEATDAQGGMAAALGSDYSFSADGTEFRVLSGLYENGGEPLVFVADTDTPNQASVKGINGGANSGAAVCVLEDDTYDAAKHNQLAGVRIDDGGSAVVLSIDAFPPSFSANTPAYTMTARAFYFNDVLESPTYALTIKDLTGLTLSVGFGDSDDANHFTLPESTSDGEIVIGYGATAPSVNAVLEIVVTPPLGEAVTLTVKFSPASAAPIGFAGTPVALSMSVRLLDVAEADDPVEETDPAGTPVDRGGANRLTELDGVDMVYGGESRGLHWMFGDAYYTSAQNLADDRPDNDGLSPRSAWFSKPICDRGNTGGNNSDKWRLPTLIEMAGGVLPASAGTGITARVNDFGSSGVRALDPFEIVGDPSNVNFLTLTVNGRNTNDADPLPPKEHNKGYFVELFDAAQNETGGYRGYPAHVHYENGEIRISQGSKGKVVCVREAESTPSYSKPPVWAEVSVDNRAGNSILTLSVTAAKVTANVKMGLGLFTVRGRETPEAVENPAVSDFSLARLDSHSAFIITPVTVSGGVSPEVSVPSDAASIPSSGIYTLSVTFAPAGEKYVGYAQRDFGKTSYGSTDESQFDVVRLTVDWTKPAVALDDSFDFGDTTIDAADGVAVVTVTNRTFGGPVERIEMKYYGDVGGLRVMYSTQDPLLNSGAGSAYGPHLCAAGGANWRNPTLTELAMLLTGPTATGLTLTVQNSG